MGELPAVCDAFVRLCMDGWHFGWHEANGGNLSCLLDEQTSSQFSCGEAAPWIACGCALPALGGRKILVTARGCYFRNMERAFSQCAGVIELNGEGSAYRCAWGFADGGQPTSELAAHLLVLNEHAGAGDAAQQREVQAATQAQSATQAVIYHAHTPSTIALSALIPPDGQAWNSALADAFTEFPFLLPEGMGILPRMEPGSADLAQANAEQLQQHRACVWQNHGVVARASTFDEAFGIVHTIEKASQIVLATRSACC